MASDDLEARKTSLEDRIDALGSWMIRFTWPVAVGLLMEFYAILEFATTQKWNASIDHMGLLLVTAGVAGELAVEQMSHTTERKLRRVNKEIDREADERIADLNLLVEQERLVRAKIEARIADRRLSFLQIESVADKLRECAGTPINVLALSVDSETIMFARDIVLARIRPDG